jgi:MFS family permease
LAKTTTSFAVLRERAVFRRAWFGTLISAFGDQLTWIALTWFVLERSGSGAAVGAVLLCFALPAAVTGPLLGRLLDRYQPRTIMIADNVARAVIVAAIPALAFVGALQLWMIFVLAALAGALAPATQIGVRVLAPHLVQIEELEAANGALAWTMQLPTVLAPALAGVIVAAWGAPAALLLDAASFLVMAWALRVAPDLQRTSLVTHTASTRSSPLRTLRDYPAVAIVTLLSLVFFFTYGPLEASLPVYAKERLGVDAQGFGLLWSALGVGALIGSLGVPWLARRKRLGVVLAFITIGWGVVQFSVGLSASLPLALVCMFIGGVIWGPYLALETSLVQRIVPPERHGQVFGARLAITTPAAPLGTAVGGAMLTIMPANFVIIGSGLLCVLAGLVAVASPALNRVSVNAGHVVTAAQATQA